jgi:putative copper resistance protein D
MAGGNGDHFPDDVRLNRQLATTSIYEHRQGDALGPTKVRQLVQRRADRSTGIQHVVDDDDPFAFDVDWNLCRSDDRTRTYCLQVIAIQRDIERAARDLRLLAIEDVGYNSRRELNPAALNSDDHEVVGPLVQLENLVSHASQRSVDRTGVELCGLWSRLCDAEYGMAGRGIKARPVRDAARPARRGPCHRCADLCPEPMQAEPLITWSEPAKELVGFVGSFLAAGAVGFRYSAARIARDAEPTDPEGAFYREGLQRAALLGVVGAVISVLLLGLGLPGAAARHKMTATAWVTSDMGTALQMIFALLAVVGLGIAWARSKAGWPIATIAIVAGALQPAFVGRFSALVNPIHRLAAGLWIGTLFIMLACGLSPLLKHNELRDRRGGIAADMVNRFSPLALSMGGVVVVFGLITAWRHLPTVSALWTTPYGYALIVKLLLVALVFGLGAFNWRRQRPTLGSESAAVSLRRSSRAEITVAFLVLVATAVVVSLPSPKRAGPPPTGAPAGGAPEGSAPP